MTDFIAYFQKLVYIEREVNNHAIKVLVAVVPRSGDWRWRKQYFIQVYDEMQKRCCSECSSGRQAFFVQTYHMFIAFGDTQREFYTLVCIHLSNVGFTTLIRVFTDGKRRRLQMGNNVVFT